MESTASSASTTAEISQDCPRYRVLVIGSSGVGKSSLINNIFHVKIADVSQNDRGYADIEKEITDPHNDRFVLHDTLGFERGDAHHFDVVKTFLSDRRARKELSERVHVIWFCIETPFAGGRVLDKYSQLLIEYVQQPEINIPIIVVFTKYDLLIRHLLKEPDIKSIPTESERNTASGERAAQFFQKKCVNVLPPQTTHVRVSVKRKYDRTLRELVETTSKLQSEDVRTITWIIGAIAQRANAQKNIDASIAVGMKKYWPTVLSDFLGQRTLYQLTDIIHTDIVNIWNFLDVDEILKGEDFRKLMRRITTPFLTDPQSGSTAPTIQDMSCLQDLLEPVADVFKLIVPIAGVSLRAGLWIADKVQQSPTTRRMVIEYILHLTLILDTLFWSRSTNRPPTNVTMTEVKDATTSYWSSIGEKQVRDAVISFINNSPWNLGHTALQEGIRDLIRRFCSPDSAP